MTNTTIDPKTLNKERLYALADAVAMDKRGSYADSIPGFDMRVWLEDVVESVRPYKACGTCRCIGGTADMIYGDHDKTLSADGEVTAALRSALDELYFPYPYPLGEDDPKNPYNATPAQAAAVIRHFADTGEVDWASVMETEAEAAAAE